MRNYISTVFRSHFHILNLIAQVHYGEKLKGDNEIQCPREKN